MAKDKSPLQRDWLVFITSLPIDDASARMQILRTLESLGCSVLREGVYLLPDTADAQQSLTRLAEHVTRLNGSAYVLHATAPDARQDGTLRALFDRSAKYEDLIRNVAGLSGAIGISDSGTLARALAKHRQEFESVRTLDIFPSPALTRAEEAIREAEHKIRRLMFPEPTSAPHGSQPVERYLKRKWATQKPLWADRLASAWLIRRFIDPEATLIWLDAAQTCPKDAVGFGFDGAPFRNTNDRVTFEELLHRFDHDKNTALLRLGALVHYLDAGGPDVAEAAGVESLLKGAIRRSSNESQLFLESEKTFDLLYESYVNPLTRA